MRARLLLSTTLTLLALAPAGRAQTPAPLAVLSSNAIRVGMEHLRPEAERTIGRRISIKYSSSTALRHTIDQGEAFDLAILTPDIVQTLVKTGRIRAGTTTDVASVDLAVGIRAGARKDDIATPGAMKRRLLAVRSLTWTEGGASAAPVEAMLRALGIAEQLRPRIALQRVPGMAADTVAHGDTSSCSRHAARSRTLPASRCSASFPRSFNVRWS